MRRLVLLTVAVGLWLCWGLPGQAQEDESRALIAKAIKAHGGAKQLAALKAAQIKGKGKIHMPMEAPFTIEVFSQDPDKLKVVIDVEVNNMNFTITQIVNGKKGWIHVMDKTQDMDAQTLAETHEMLHVEKVTSLVALKGKDYKLSPLGEAKVQGHDTVGLQVTKKGQRDVNLYFDKKSHMLLKAEYRALDPSKQEVTQEKLFTEYKTLASGVKVPVKMIVNNDGKRFLDLEVTEATIVDRHDDSVFAKP